MWFSLKNKGKDSQDTKGGYIPPADISYDTPAHEVSDDRFEYFLSYAYGLLPASIRKHLKNLSIVVSDEYNPRLYGLYQGVPLTKRLNNHAGMLPDVITIYRETIKAASRTEYDVYEQARKTLFHEIGHYLGMGHDVLGKHGY